MARTVIDPQDTSAQNGLTIVTEPANVDGNAIVNNGRRFLFVDSDSGTDATITQITGGTVSGLSVADPQVTVPANGFAILGPWPGIYNQPNGEVHVDYSDVTDLNVAVVEV